MSLPDFFRGPALVDLQVNGYAGFDFNSDPATWTAGDFRAVGLAMRRRGVGVAFPTFITDDTTRLIARARQYARLIEHDSELSEMFPRLHIEGPFISREDGPRGAHPLAFCTVPSENADFLEHIQDASGGRIGILTLAPELPGAIDLIARAAGMGICVAIGHTAADADTLTRAVSAGARLSTHLGNGSHQVLPRLDNYVQQQLADDRLYASFIADGHHIPFTTLKNFIRAKTPERCVLITDAIAAADAGPGQYMLGGEKVVVTEDLRVSKPGQPNLAGSALTLDRAVLHTAHFCDVTFDQAWQMASQHPAALVGLDPLPEVSVRITKEGFVDGDEAG